MGALIDGAIAADAELVKSSGGEEIPRTTETFDIRVIPGVRS
jgi:hypothetical protein